MSKNKQVFDFSIVKSINEIPRKDWDILFGEGLIESYGYLKTLEEGEAGEFSFRYLIAKENNRIVFILPFFVMKFSFTLLFPDFLHKAANLFNRW
ncbi:MAG: hypothetical protein WCY12_06860, partial [Candidatus Omnitrophota bacterium]